MLLAGILVVVAAAALAWWRTPWGRRFPGVVVLAAALLLSLVGWSDILVLRPPAGRNRATRADGISISASSAFTREGYDTAYLLDGRTEPSWLAWRSQHDAAPRLQVTASRGRLRRVGLVFPSTSAASVAVRVSCGGRAWRREAPQGPEVTFEAAGAGCREVQVLFPGDDAERPPVQLVELRVEQEP